ncbi:MAG: right-handed parallel beta-helix repeat-containing protein [Planctomycetota bacterium]
MRKLQGVRVSSARVLSGKWLSATVLSLAVAFGGFVPLLAATLAVPADHATIQQAIVAANPGDVVEVAPGVYPEQIDFLGKAIRVQSTGGPAVTTIDGQQLGSVVLFTHGEGPDSVLTGFTIANGQISAFDLDQGGGGIRCLQSSPTIRGNVIRDNLAPWNGAGIYCVDSTALIADNSFVSNSFFALIADAPYGRGGGVCVQGGAVTIVNNVFDGNEAYEFGGGVFCVDTLGTMIQGNIFRNNLGGWGGAIAIGFNSDVTIRNNLIHDNTAIGHTSFAGPGEGLGGGIYLSSTASVRITNATIVSNVAVPGFSGSGSGGGIHSDSFVFVLPTLGSSIVRDNMAGVGPQVAFNLDVTYCNVEGGAFGIGNFDADPVFVTGPLGDFYLSQVAAGQGSDSPCVDAGDPVGGALVGTTTRTDHAPDTGLVDVGYHVVLGQAVGNFRRADCNADGNPNIADAVFLLGGLFPVMGQTNSFSCRDACDANDDGALNIADAVALLNSLFGNPPQTLPPPVSSCGADPTADALDCLVFPPC